MRVLITGATGFVGSNIAAVLAARGYAVVAGVRSERVLPWPCLEMPYADEAALAIAMADFDAVVHCAIANDFERLQADRRYAHDSYVGLTSRLTRAANAVGARMIFLSSDWVFDGTGHLVPEDEPVNPVNFYGLLKALGEQVVLDLQPQGAICRVGGVMGQNRLHTGGPRSQDVGFGYFVASLVAALKDGTAFTVWQPPGVNEIATIALASEIGAGIDRILGTASDGIFHLVSDEPVTRLGLARAAAQAFDLDEGLIRTGPVPPASRFPAPVPIDTSMSRRRTVRKLGLAPASIRALLEAFHLEFESGHPHPLTPHKH
jgi:dTDP-4-dehydrorhamnose reductase